MSLCIKIIKGDLLWSQYELNWDFPLILSQVSIFFWRYWDIYFHVEIYYRVFFPLFLIAIRCRCVSNEISMIEDRKKYISPLNPICTNQLSLIHLLECRVWDEIVRANGAHARIYSVWVFGVGWRFKVLWGKHTGGKGMKGNAPYFSRKWNTGMRVAGSGRNQ